MNEQTKADIRKSIAILKEKGWTRGAFVNNDGEVCLVGALRMAIFGTAHPWMRETEENLAAWRRLDNAYSVVYDVTVTRPEKFNDMPGQKRRRVIRALREAEARA